MKDRGAYTPSTQQIECAVRLIRNLLEKEDGFFCLARQYDVSTLRVHVWNPGQLDRNRCRQELILREALELMYGDHTITYDASLQMLGWNKELSRTRKPCSSDRYKERRLARGPRVA